MRGRPVYWSSHGRQRNDAWHREFCQLVLAGRRPRLRSMAQIGFARLIGSRIAPPMPPRWYRRRETAPRSGSGRPDCYARCGRNRAAAISKRTGLPRRQSADGQEVSGIYRERLQLASGRFAMLDDGLGFELVPWRPQLDRHLGQHVSGMIKTGGGIEWSLGRARGLSI